MPTILFSQRTTENGQIALSLTSPDLPSGGFTFSLGLNYTGASVHFSSATYSGAAAVTTSAGETDLMGSVNISGSITPSSGVPFATILFDASGKGSFDADITQLKINGFSAGFNDPAAYTYSILGQTVDLSLGGNASGTYNPLDSFFGLSYALKNAPQHGSVVFGDAANPAAWNYTPAAGFYGTDTFTLQVSDVFDTKQKTFSVNVSPASTQGNDTFRSSTGSYHLDGGDGIDTLATAAKIANLTVERSGTTAVVKDNSGVEDIKYLDHVERIVGSDGAIALDIDGIGGQAYRLYQAAFNRAPDAGGLGYWIGVLDKGTSLSDVANGFLNANEFKSVYGAAPTTEQLVSLLYQNVLHRQPEKAGVDYWVDILNTGKATSAGVLASMSESAENQHNVAEVIGNGFAYQPYGG